MKRLQVLRSGWELIRGEDPRNSTDRFSATVPGNVAADMWRAGLIPDPLAAENFRCAAWVSEETFWYRLQVKLPAECRGADRVELVFDGLDTFAEIFANGQSLGHASNMFRRHRFVVPPVLAEKTEEMEILVRIDPVLKAGRKWIAEKEIDLDKTMGAFAVPERMGIRKMQMSFGWDNCPHLLAGGIFRTPRLEITRGASFREVSWKVAPIDRQADLAVLEFPVTIDREVPGGTLEIAGECGTSRISATWPLDGIETAARVSVEQPRLWWPRGMGDPDLYSFTLVLRSGDGKELDRHTLRLGIRTIELDTSVQEIRTVDYRLGASDPSKITMDGGFLTMWGREPLPNPKAVEIHRFQLRVNGEPVFLRGANWQTPDIFPGLVDASRYRTLCEAAAGTNLNLLRLWGGGIVEDDCFYEICSELGLLVWQDFHFASGRYPQEAAFLEEIRMESADIIRRLRHHTCLAIWCGDNEHDMIDADSGRDPSLNPVNKKIIPENLHLLDPQRRPYHPSSPSGGPYPRSEWAGDRRDWGAWYPHKDYEHIRLDQGRVISEGGSYALPDPATTREFIPEAVRWPLNRTTWSLHGGDVDRQKRNFSAINQTCWGFFGRAGNWEEATEISQFSQAWGYKRLIEHHRRRMQECGGVILWKLNDCWPANDAGLLDFRLHPRLSDTFVREAFQPVAVSVQSSLPGEPAGVFAIWLVNDNAGPVNGELTLKIFQHDGGKWSENSSLSIHASCPARSSAEIHRTPVLAAPESTVLTAEFGSGTESCRTWFSLSPATALAFHRSHLFPAG